MRLYIYKVCDTPELRAEGLQNEIINEDECCVFEYGSFAQSPTFWGKNTLEDLYVSLVSGHHVVDCKKIRAFDLTPVKLSGSGDMALETKVPLPIGSIVRYNIDWIDIE